MSHESSVLTMEMQLYGLKRAIVRRQGGEELFQEVCLKCMKQSDARDWRRAQHGFIKQVARTTSIDMNRAKKIRANYSAQVSNANPIGNEADPSESAAQAEVASILQSALQRLPERYRIALIALRAEHVT